MVNAQTYQCHFTVIYCHLQSRGCAGHFAQMKIPRSLIRVVGNEWTGVGPRGQICAQIGQGLSRRELECACPHGAAGGGWLPCFVRKLRSLNLESKDKEHFILRPWFGGTACFSNCPRGSSSNWRPSMEIQPGKGLVTLTGNFTTSLSYCAVWQVSRYVTIIEPVISFFNHPHSQTTDLHLIFSPCE